MSNEAIFFINNNGYFYVLFLGRAHSPFIKNTKTKQTNKKTTTM